jgi:hypothetical protein
MFDTRAFNLEMNQTQPPILPKTITTSPTIEMMMLVKLKPSPFDYPSDGYRAALHDDAEQKKEDQRVIGVVSEVLCVSGITCDLVPGTLLAQGFQFLTVHVGQAVDRQFQTCPHAGLVEKIGDVPLHCILGDAENNADVVVAFSLGDEIEYLLLA